MLTLKFNLSRPKHC